MKARAQAEYDQLKKVVIKEPGLEARFGSTVPKAALFQGAFDSSEAKQEFKQMEETLKQYATPIKVDDALLNNRESLKKLAQQSSNLVYDNINLMDKSKIEDESSYVFDLLSDDHLLEIVLTQPTTKVKYSGTNTGLVEEKTVAPLYNLLFCRDQQITTDKGIVLGNMNSAQRGSETKIMETVFGNLGVDNLYALGDPDAKLEGGDFIPAGERAFIGYGLRTNKEAIDELLQEQRTGYDEVVVVEDKVGSQDEMHLDTYFNVISKDKVALLETRMTEDEKQGLTAHLYTKKDDGSYEKAGSKQFHTYLQDNGYDIIPIREQEQRAYGINFLTLSPNKVIGVDIEAKQEHADLVTKIAESYGKEADPFFKQDFDRLGKELMEKMDSNGVEYTPLRFNMLNMMYGSVHCMTQAIEREPNLNGFANKEAAATQQYVPKETK